MLPGKARQPREQPLSCKPERHSDHELLLPTISEKLGQCSVEPLERLAANGDEGFARKRESQAPRMPHEQLLAQPQLQQPHLLANCCWRVIQLGCSGRESEAPRLDLV